MLGEQKISGIVGLDWLRDQALPFWATKGFDDAGSSFIERMDPSGQPLFNHPRRAMTQARQVFVYARAQANGWYQGAGMLAKVAFSNLVENYFEADGRPGWVFSCDPKGNIIDGRRDCYSQAFCLLACAQHAMLTGETLGLDLADRTLEFMDAAMASPYGGYDESWPIPVLPRRQNPHMHLMESLLALHEVDQKRGYFSRAAQLVDLFNQRFLQVEGRCLGEFYEEDWTPRNSQSSFEPGHHFEWVWLLHRYEVAGGDVTLSQRKALLVSAISGFREDGLLVDEKSVTGPIIGTATRLWPLTEAMKALALPEAEEIEAPSPKSCWHALQRRFLSGAPKGCWQDYFTADGAQLMEFIPASSLYHLCCAIDFIASI